MVLCELPTMIGNEEHMGSSYLLLLVTPVSYGRSSRPVLHSCTSIVFVCKVVCVRHNACLGVCRRCECHDVSVMAPACAMKYGSGVVLKFCVVYKHTMSLQVPCLAIEV